MAVLSFTITYDDEKQADLLAALHDHYGEKEPGVPYTAMELKGMLQSKFVSELRAIYIRWKSTQTNPDDLGAA